MRKAATIPVLALLALGFAGSAIAQAPQWSAFADALRAGAERLRAATTAAIAGGPGPLPDPQQMERRIALLSADELAAEHFRAMRMGMP
jgi:hypothetical protein